MEYMLTTRDILQILKRQWKIILLAMVIFGGLGAGYAVLNAGVDPNAEYASEEEIAAYEQWGESKTVLTTMASNDLVNICNYINGNPVMQLDPTDCKVLELTFTFDQKETATREFTVEGWIDTIPDKDLFGKDSKELAPYRSDLIRVDADGGGTVVTMFAVDSYDANAAAAAIEKKVKARASAAKIPVVDYTKATVKGFSQRLHNTQDLLRTDARSLYTDLYNMKKYSDVTQAPLTPENDGVSMRSLIKFGGAGAIGGLFLAVAAAILLGARKRQLLSEDQVESSLGLMPIGTYKSGNAGRTKLLAATIDALRGDRESLMVLDDGEEEAAEQMAAALGDASSCSFRVGKAFSEEVDTLETLSGVDGILLLIRLGKTTFEDIQQKVQWAERFGKDVLGYVSLED